MPAAIPIVAAVGGGLIAANASKKAANTQASAADRTLEIQNQQYEQTRADQLKQYEQNRADQLGLLEQQRTDYAPYREAGYGALSQLTGGLAPGGEFSRRFGMSDFQEDPGYQFRQQQGEQAINRSAGAAGSRYSGATLKALQRFNSDLSSQEYGNAYNRYQTDVGSRYNRLAGLAGVGQTATGSTSQAGQSAYGSIGSAGQNAYGTIASAGQNRATGASTAISDAAAARASGYVGAANALTGSIGKLANLAGGGTSSPFTAYFG